MVIREDKIVRLTHLKCTVREKCGDWQQCVPNLVNFDYLISMIYINNLM